MKTLARHIIIAIILTTFGGCIAYAQTATPSSSQSPDTIQGLPVVTPLPIPSFSIPKLPGGGVSVVQPLTIVATPSSPSPGQTVTIEAQTPTFDPNRATFNWTIDGISKSDISGIGKKTFTFVAGPVGSVTRVSVRIFPADAASVSGSLTIYTTDLALTWTAQTYIPKWYKGKALAVPNSRIRIAAIPTFIIGGTTLSPDRLIYTWSIDGNRVLKGAGKQVLETIQPDTPWSNPLIILQVSDANQRIQKEMRMGIVSREPRAVIYHTLPLGGIEFRRGAASFPPTKPGIVDLEAEPFFFNKDTRHDMTYEWSVKNQIISGNAQNPFLLTLDMQQQTAGDFPILLTVKETDPSVPRATTFINIPIQ